MAMLVATVESIDAKNVHGNIANESNGQVGDSHFGGRRPRLAPCLWQLSFKVDGVDGTNEQSSSPITGGGEGDCKVSS
eukprot:1482741-Pleurochrysis_carterae.AAC.2